MTKSVRGWFLARCQPGGVSLQADHVGRASNHEIWFFVSSTAKQYRVHGIKVKAARRVKP